MTDLNPLLGLLGGMRHFFCGCAELGATTTHFHCFGGGTTARVGNCDRKDRIAETRCEVTESFDSPWLSSLGQRNYFMGFGLYVLGKADLV